MPTVTTADGTEIFYKDWGAGQPIVFSHGWPLSADDWDTQMMFFLQHGYRVIAHDRRGHGRSTQTADGHDMDHYADDMAAVTAHLDLHDAVTSGTRPAAARWCATSPATVRAGSQGGAHQRGAAAHGADRRQSRRPAEERLRRISRSSWRPTARSSTAICRRARSTASTVPAWKPSEAIIENWWRQGMMGGAKAHYDGIVAFSQTDFTEDLKKITVPVLVMHGEDDQIVPYADSGPLSANCCRTGRSRPTKASRTACPPRRLRSSTPTCSHSSGPDRTARHRVGAAEAERPDGPWSGRGL